MTKPSTTPQQQQLQQQPMTTLQFMEQCIRQTRSAARMDAASHSHGATAIIATAARTTFNSLDSNSTARTKNTFPSTASESMNLWDLFRSASSFKEQPVENAAAVATTTSINNSTNQVDCKWTNDSESLDANLLLMGGNDYDNGGHNGMLLPSRWALENTLLLPPPPTAPKTAGFNESIDGGRFHSTDGYFFTSCDSLVFSLEPLETLETNNAAPSDAATDMIVAADDENESILPNDDDVAAAPLPPPLLPVQLELPPPTSTARAAPKRKRKRKRGIEDEDDPASRIYITNDVTDADVLLGRGGLANNHEGNKTYLDHKTTMQDRYFALSKNDKKAVSEELVQWVLNRGGRFLKQEKVSLRWYQVSAKAARFKASQTLREAYTTETRAIKRAKYKKSKPKCVSPS